MKITHKFICLIAATAAACAAVAPAGATDTWTDIIPGVRHLHRVTAAEPWNIHALVVDVTNPRVRVGAIIKNESPGPDSGETVRSMAERHGALAAINGDYFQNGTVQDHIPQGISVHDGYKIPISGFISGRLSWAMDGTTKESVLGAYSAAESWMYTVVSGGPRLLKDGDVNFDYASGLPSAGSLNPRTALGISQDKKKLILAVVDGRQTISRGMTGSEMAAFLQELGAWNAINYDGGGSSTFYLNGSVRNSPSDGSERRVANAIAVWDRAAPGQNPGVALGTGFEPPVYAQAAVGGQDGWSGSGTARVTGDQPASGVQSLELDQGSADHSVTTSSATVQWIDFLAKRQTGQGWGVCYFGVTPSSNVFGIVGYLNGGNLSYWEGNKIGGGSWKTLAPYTLGQWQRISVRLDYGKLNYSVYVDGRQRVLGAAYRDAASTSGLGGIRLNDSGTGAMYVDNFYVGNTRFDFPRVQPDTGTVPVAGYLPMELLNAEGTASWQVFDERDTANNPVSAGTIAAIDASGVVYGLAPGSFRVKGTDSVPRIDLSERITVVPSSTVAAARQAPTGSPVQLGSAVVTGVFPGHVYVEQPDRASGLRVNASQAVSVGQRVSVNGTAQTLNGEKLLAQAVITPGPLGAQIAPLAMQSRHATTMLEGSTKMGLDPSGLLVRIYGRVTRIEADRFYVTDGGIGGDGIPVVWPGLDAGLAGRYAAIAGPLATFVDAAGPVAAVKPRQISDIILID